MHKVYIGVIVTFKSNAEIINVPQIIWILPHISILELYFLQNLKYIRLLSELSLFFFLYDITKYREIDKNHWLQVSLIQIHDVHQSFVVN